ncbi:MAG: hypothetical protein GY861_06445 [bacterium]|nr:hypothetical protein [bacterium]
MGKNSKFEDIVSDLLGMEGGRGTFVTMDFGSNGAVAEPRSNGAIEHPRGCSAEELEGIVNIPTLRFNKEPDRTDIYDPRKDTTNKAPLISQRNSPIITADKFSSSTSLTRLCNHIDNAGNHRYIRPGILNSLNDMFYGLAGDKKMAKSKLSPLMALYVLQETVGKAPSSLLKIDAGKYSHIKWPLTVSAAPAEVDGKPRLSVSAFLADVAGHPVLFEADFSAHYAIGQGQSEPKIYEKQEAAKELLDGVMPGYVLMVCSDIDIEKRGNIGILNTNDRIGRLKNKFSGNVVHSCISSGDISTLFTKAQKGESIAPVREITPYIHGAPKA